MKIAHLITRLIIGGAQENTLLTCEGLAGRGHEVTLIAGPETGPEGSLWPRAEKLDGQVIRIDSLRRSIRPLCELRAAKALTNLFRHHGFDVVHTHSSKAGIIGRYAAHQAKTPIVVHTIHGMSFNRTQLAPIRWLYRTLERRAGRWTNAFVSVADAMTAQAVEAGVAPASRFVTVRSGMETAGYSRRPADRQEVRAQWQVPEEAVVVGTVARLFRNKGYEHLMLAMPAIAAACPNVRFVWVGDGAHRRQYEELLTRMELRDRVHMTGLVQPEEIPRLMNGFDILAHASMWEGLARSLVQASLTEVPAVSFDNDGAPEVVHHGRTGYLVPVGDSKTLTDRIVELATDAELRDRMGRAARQACMNEFDHEVMVQRLDELYAKLVDRPGDTADR